jgi:hypothetical protein
LNARFHLRPSQVSYLTLVAVLVAGVVLNVLQFRSLDDEAPRHYAALHRYETDDLVTIGHRNRQVRSYYGLYFTLAEIAPNSTVIVSSSVLTDTRGIAGRLYAFGAVSHLVITPLSEDTFLLPADTSPGVSGLIDPTPFIVVQGSGGSRLASWAIALDPAAASTGPTREFAFLHWEGPIGESTRNYLLIETSLLPGAAAEGLGQ